MTLRITLILIGALALAACNSDYASQGSNGYDYSSTNY